MKINIKSLLNKFVTKICIIILMTSIIVICWSERLKELAEQWRIVFVLTQVCAAANARVCWACSQLWVFMSVSYSCTMIQFCSI
jgi:hypothetical protein